MKRFALAAVAACVLTLAACGGSSHHQPLHPPLSGLRLPPGAQQLPLTVTAVPSAEMFDSVTLSTVPSRPFALAGYVGGSWPTYSPMRRTYPSAHTVSIAVNAGERAACLDDEPGDASPSQAGPWAAADYAAGFRTPCVYSDGSDSPAVNASLAAWRFPHCTSSTQTHCSLRWLATNSGHPGLLSGFDAVQWTWSAFGRNLDESTVSLAFLRIAQPPVSTAPPNAPGCSTPSTKTSYCFGRFTTVTRYDRPSGSKTAKVKPWCYYGCEERNLIGRLTGELFAAQTPAGLHPDEQRASFLCRQLIYFEQHRSVQVNGSTYTYGRKSNVCGRSRGFRRGSWSSYL